MSSIDVIDDEWLNKLIDRIRVLKHSKHRQVFKEVTDVLQNCPLRPGKIVKAGSLGKGTMVKANDGPNASGSVSDVDIVFEIQNVSVEEFDLLQQKKALLPFLKAVLETRIPALLQSEIEFTSHGLKFCYKELEVDLIPVPSMGGRNILDIPAPLRKWCNSCLAEEQIELFKDLTPLQKDWIRLLKFWKSRFVWPANTPKLPSYFLELIALSIFQSERPPDRVSGFLDRFFGALKNVNALNIDISRHEAQIPSDVRKQPFVGDPINPTVNVADRLIQYPELLRALANAISYGKDALKKNHRELPTDKPAAISPVSAPSTPGAKSVVQTMPTSSSTLASASKPASAVAVSVPVRNPPPAPSPPPPSLAETAELRQRLARQNIIYLRAKKKMAERICEFLHVDWLPFQQLCEQQHWIRVESNGGITWIETMLEVYSISPKTPEPRELSPADVAKVLLACCEKRALKSVGQVQFALVTGGFYAHDDVKRVEFAKRLHPLLQNR